MNATMKKFGAPDTCVTEFEHWTVLLRPQQVTLGALVVVSSEPARAFSDLSRAAFMEFHDVVGCVERSLKRAFDYQKLNYLMLMMVDPDVHFHVLPRYAETQVFASREFNDPGWPGPPELGQVNQTDAATTDEILAHLREVWS